MVRAGNPKFEPECPGIRLSLCRVLIPRSACFVDATDPGVSERDDRPERSSAVRCASRYPSTWRPTKNTSGPVTWSTQRAGAYRTIMQAHAQRCPFVLTVIEYPPFMRHARELKQSYTRSICAVPCNISFVSASL